MRLRDRPYAQYRVVLAFAGMRDDIIDGLPNAVADYLDEAPADLLDSHPAFRRLSSSRRRAELAAGSVQVPAGTTLARMIAEAAALSYDRLPVRLVTSGDAVVIGVSHAIGDGRIALEMSYFVINRAAGLPTAVDSRAVVRRPMIAALKKKWRSAYPEYLELRRSFSPWRAPEPLAEPAAPAFTTFRIDEDVVGRIVAARDGAGRSTPTSRLASIALAALREVQLRPGDIPVAISMDLRRYSGSGRVPGNFVAVDPYGLLGDDTWTAAEIAAKIADRVRSGLPVVTSALTIVRQLRSTATGWLPRRSRGGGSAPAIALSILAAPEDFADEVWKPGSEQVCATATLGAAPSATYIAVLKQGDAMRVHLWDDSGTFDVEGFSAAFYAEAERRTAVVPAV